MGVNRKMTKKKIGDTRPYYKLSTGYTPELAEEICDEISTSSYSIQCICEKNQHFPNYKMILKWLEIYPEFRLMHARAKQAQSEFLVDMILKIIDKPETYIENGVLKNDVPMMRLKVQTIQWIASKLNKEKYGDVQKVQNEIMFSHEEKLKELT